MSQLLLPFIALSDVTPLYVGSVRRLWCSRLGAFVDGE